MWLIVGVYAVLAATAAAAGSDSVVFIKALDYVAAVGYKEPHDAACSRVGLLATETVVSLGGNTSNLVVWMQDVIASVISTVPNATSDSQLLQGCCSPSLWCRRTPQSYAAGAPPSYACFTNRLGGTQYSNYGWTLDSNSTPVYTCTDPGLSPIAVAAQLPYIGAVNVLYNQNRYAVRVRIDGLNFNVTESALSVRVGDATCANLDVCQDICKSCMVDSECGQNKQCMHFGSSDQPGYCMRLCNDDNTCPCGGTCYLILIDQQGDVIRMCANPNVSSLSDICQNYAWGPAISTGMTDRIECTPTTSIIADGRRVLTAAGAGPAAITGGRDSDLQQESELRSAAAAPSIDLYGSLSAGSKLANVASRRAHSQSPQRRLGQDDALPIHNSIASTPDRGAASTGRSLANLIIVGTGAASGGDRYNQLCAGGGAAAAGFPGAYPIVVSRDRWSSTGLGDDVIADYNISLPWMNNTQAGLPNSSSVAFASLGYSGWIPGFTVPPFTGICTTDADCPLVDSCTVPKCVITSNITGTNCCAYVPSGRCDTNDSPIRPGEAPTSSTVFALPSDVSSLLPLPPPPRGSLGYRNEVGDKIVDPSVRNPEYNPRAILWDAGSVWYNITANDASVVVFPTDMSTFHLSIASEVDDGPMEQKTLNGWRFPFYGASIATLYISPNGYIRVTSTNPCQSTFACSFVNDYGGIIGPLVTDFDPGSYGASEIWFRDMDATRLFDTARYGNAPPSARAFCTVYSNMGLYRSGNPDPNILPNPSFTYEMCLYGDGGIRWRYGRVFGQPAPADGSWNETTAIPTANAGPPSTVSPPWIAAVRSLSATVKGPAAEAAALSKYRSQSSPSDSDVSLQSATEVVLSRAGVRPGGTANFCSLNQVACASPSCGTAGTVVQLTWGGVGCGMGFEALLPSWAAGTAGSAGKDVLRPSFECVFGSAAVPATWTSSNVSGGATYSLQCVAPLLPEVTAAISSSSTGMLPVPLSLQIVLPLDERSYSSGNSSDGKVYATGALNGANGIGPAASAVNISGGYVVEQLDVYGMLSVTYGSPASGSGNTTVTPPRVTVLIPRPLQFTYSLNSSFTCGCDAVSASATCDACLVCGGGGSSRDCAGVCFGTAVIDSCGICSGGTTMHVPNSDQDCNGVCFGPIHSCEPTVKPNPIAADNVVLTMIVVVALFTCLFALFTVLAYFGWLAYLRRRNMDQTIEQLIMGDAEVLGLPAGLSTGQLSRMPARVFDPADEVFKNSVPGGCDACPICMEDFKANDNVRQMPPCGHIFHVLCVDTWLTRSTVCPNCRAELRTREEVEADLGFRRERAAEVVRRRQEQREHQLAQTVAPVSGPPDNAQLGVLQPPPGVTFQIGVAGQGGAAMPRGWNQLHLRSQAAAGGGSAQQQREVELAQATRNVAAGAAPYGNNTTSSNARDDREEVVLVDTNETRRSSASQVVPVIAVSHSAVSGNRAQQPQQQQHYPNPVAGVYASSYPGSGAGAMPLPPSNANSNAGAQASSRSAAGLQRNGFAPVPPQFDQLHQQRALVAAAAASQRQLGTGSTGNAWARQMR